MSSSDGHDHDHDHPVFRDDNDVEDTALLRYRALRSLLIDKGFVNEQDLRTVVERMERVGPESGSRIVATAWTDENFKARLLRDGKSTVAELGYEMAEADLIVVENTPALHNLVVCTLCSCYPRSLLGQPPSWYVSRSYRTRAVREPRAVLAEFGVKLPDDVEVRVHDSNADMRYLVLPARPPETEGWPIERLEALVTRDCLIGTAVPRL